MTTDWRREKLRSLICTRKGSVLSCLMSSEGKRRAGFQRFSEDARIETLDIAGKGRLKCVVKETPSGRLRIRCRVGAGWPKGGD
jgi:hypothetical protein